MSTRAGDRHGRRTPTVQNLSVTVTNVNEAPSFTSSSSVSVPENSTRRHHHRGHRSGRHHADLLDHRRSRPGALLHHPAPGVLTFISGRDYENPTDADANNVYEVIVTATDGTNNVPQSISVTVTNVNEAPVFSSANTASVPENSTRPSSPWTPMMRKGRP